MVPSGRKVEKSAASIGRGLVILGVALSSNASTM